MKKKDVKGKKKANLDLDKALAEVAKTLRPVASKYDDEVNTSSCGAPNAHSSQNDCRC